MNLLRKFLFGYLVLILTLTGYTPSQSNTAQYSLGSRVGRFIAFHATSRK